MPDRLSLTATQVWQFITDGFVRVEGAFSPEVAAEGRTAIWTQMGKDPGNPATWTEPVVRLVPSERGPFRAAINTSRLHVAFDQLVGQGRWYARPDCGLFVVRFPAAAPPGDTGWHIDASYLTNGTYWVNLWSRERALLMLPLFSDIGQDDAPTRLRVGSHLDVPQILAPAGEGGMEWPELSERASAASAGRPVALATGKAGDVYLCHPFVVHAAQPHRGSSPRFMAQPPLMSKGPLQLDRAAGDYSPVEIAVRRALSHTKNSPGS
ncbi:MAG: phytanoyl-CoA dioxygenase family protein [Thaumarchaeota archaeon]|nr:phytanoyl-CoA dioxygenase family protein [Nitrososphaerota archaeon]